MANKPSESRSIHRRHRRRQRPRARKMLREKSWDKILTLRQSGRVGPMSGDEGKSLDEIHLTAASYNAGALVREEPLLPRPLATPTTRRLLRIPLPNQRCSERRRGTAPARRALFSNRLAITHATHATPLMQITGQILRHTEFPHPA